MRLEAARGARHSTWVLQPMHYSLSRPQGRLILFILCLSLRMGLTLKELLDGPLRWFFRHSLLRCQELGCRGTACLSGQSIESNRLLVRLRRVRRYLPHFPDPVSACQDTPGNRHACSMSLAAAEAASASVKAVAPSARRAHDTFTLLPAGPEGRFATLRTSGRDALSLYSRTSVIGLLRQLSAQLWFRAVFRTSFFDTDCGSCRHPVLMRRVLASLIMFPAVARCDGALSVCVGCLWEETLAKGPLM